MSGENKDIDVSKIKKPIIIGKKYGKLTPLKISYKKGSSLYYECICECGKKTISRDVNLRTGRAKSCGCERIENQIKAVKKYNDYDLSGEYGIGYTSKKEKFYFDLEDYDIIKNFCWYVNKQGYIYTAIKYGKLIGMHRLIFQDVIKDSEVVDHIHGKATRNDNRKANLRICTSSQNSMNRKYEDDRDVGVYFNKNRNSWSAKIERNGKFYSKNGFKTREEAILARKKLEDEYFGEYSYDNSQKIDYFQKGYGYEI